MEFIDPDVRAAHMRLMDALCSWERTTGREIMLLVIPHDADEPVALSFNGKPGGREPGLADVLFAVGMALQSRAPAQPEGRRA
jgi:hypothetical protein